MSDRGNQGAVLVIILLALVVLGALGMLVSLRSTQEGQLVLREFAETKAFWIAEAGIQKAYWDIINNDCRGMRDRASGSVCASCECTGGEKQMAGSLSGGAYTVIINAATTQVNATGSYTLNANAAPITREVQLRLIQQPIFGYAAFSSGAMTFSNNSLADSYNSTLGEYGGANVGSSGSIGSTGGSVDVISLSNNVTIKGDVSTGAGGTITLGTGSTITGSVTHANSIPPAPVIVPAALTGLTSSGTLGFSNNETKTLLSGDYKYDNISLVNNNELVISGEVRLYLTQNPSILTGSNGKVTINSGASLKIYTNGVVTFGNNFLCNNVSKDPSKFMIFSTYSGANGVTIDNNGNFYGAVYAAETDVDVSNNADIFGSIIGKTVDVSNNGAVHYDTALGTVVAEETPPVVRDWREI